MSHSKLVIKRILQCDSGFVSLLPFNIHGHTHIYRQDHTQTQEHNIFKVLELEFNCKTSTELKSQPTENQVFSLSCILSGHQLDDRTHSSTQQIDWSIDFFFFQLSQSLQILFYSQGEILWSSNDDQFQGSELNPQVKEGNLIAIGF